MAMQIPLVEAQPGERFAYVFIPADSSQPLEERTESAEGGLENDKLSKSLRAGTEVGPNIDITAVRPTGLDIFGLSSERYRRLTYFNNHVKEARPGFCGFGAY